MPHLFELEAGEHIVAEVRKHLFVFYSQVFSLFIIALVPLLFTGLAVRTLSDITAHPVETFFFLYILFVLFLWVLFFLRWTDYYLDVWVITNRRIFDIEQRGMFSREIATFRIDRIQDITVRTEGLLATALRFGDVHIHTASEHQNIIIKNARKPLEVKRIVMDVHNTRDGGSQEQTQTTPST